MFFLQVIRAGKNRIQSILPLEFLQSLTVLEVPENPLTSFKETFSVLLKLVCLNVLDIDKAPCFMKTPRAFDILACAFTLNRLNGLKLLGCLLKVDSVVRAKIKILKKSDSILTFESTVNKNVYF